MSTFWQQWRTRLVWVAVGLAVVAVAALYQRHQALALINARAAVAKAVAGQQHADSVAASTKKDAALTATADSAAMVVVARTKDSILKINRELAAKNTKAMQDADSLATVVAALVANAPEDTARNAGVYWHRAFSQQAVELQQVRGTVGRLQTAYDNLVAVSAKQHATDSTAWVTTHTADLVAYAKLDTARLASNKLNDALRTELAQQCRILPFVPCLSRKVEAVLVAVTTVIMVKKLETHTTP